MAVLVGTAMAVSGLAQVVAQEQALVGTGLVLGGASTLLLVELWRRNIAHQERLNDLLVASERVANGEVQVFVAEGSGQLGHLARQFNRLADQTRSARLGLLEERMLDQAMARESPTGLLVAKKNSLILRHNPALLRLVPPKGEVQGRTIRDAFGIPELVEVVDEATRTRTPTERSVSVQRRDLLLRGVPLADGTSCLGVVLDVTSMRLAERARRDFVANVSHELRTPITAMMGYAESLLEERDQLPDHLVPMLKAIDRNGRRLSALVEDVLHLSKLDARTGDLPLERERMEPLLAEILERFVHRALDNEVLMEVRVPPDLEALVNPDALQHALGNLVDNAIKYSPPRGRVRVVAAREGSRVRVTVEDQGPGIAAEHLERIFERFYRADEGRARSVGGTGLGLALVKHLCKATQAEVTVESAVGKGSWFTLWLPG